MFTQIAAAAHAATTAALVGTLPAACAPAADIAGMWLDRTAEQPRRTMPLARHGRRNTVQT